MMNSTGGLGAERNQGWWVGGRDKLRGRLAEKKKDTLHALCSAIYRERSWTPKRDWGIRRDTIHVPSVN